MTDEEQRYKDLKREFDNPAFRRKLKESKPDHFLPLKFVCCGNRGAR